MASKKDHAADIAAKLIEMIENSGSLPWTKTWQFQGGSAPANLKSGKSYRGINIWILLLEAMDKGYTSPWWMTYKQAKGLGGHVRKGEKGTKIVFWRIVKKTEEDDDGNEKKVSFPVMRVYTVFNAEQCEGLEDALPAQVENDLEPIAAAQAVVEGYTNAPAMGVGKPAYWPAVDRVTMPPMGTFDTAEAYYSTLFHELTHSTGHGSRLNRDEVTNPAMFGSHDYSREELVAEMGAAMLCAHTGVENSATLENSAAYLKNWLGVIKGDPKMLISAAQRAQKAVDHVLGA